MDKILYKIQKYEYKIEKSNDLDKYNQYNEKINLYNNLIGGIPDETEITDIGKDEDTKYLKVNVIDELSEKSTNNSFGFPVKSDVFDFYSSMICEIFSFFQYLNISVESFSIRGGAVQHILFDSELNDFDIQIEKKYLIELKKKCNLFPKTGIEYVVKNYAIRLKKINETSGFEGDKFAKFALFNLILKNIHNGYQYEIDLIQKTSMNKDFDFTSIMIDYRKNNVSGILNLTRKMLKACIDWKKNIPQICYLIKNIKDRSKYDNKYIRRIVLRILKFMKKGGKVKGIKEFQDTKEKIKCFNCKENLNKNSSDLLKNQINFCEKDHYICLRCFIYLSEKSFDNSNNEICPICSNISILSPISRINNDEILNDSINIKNFEEDVKEFIKIFNCSERYENDISCSLNKKDCKKNNNINWNWLSFELENLDKK
jgi:hypothetical protein